MEGMEKSSQPMENMERVLGFSKTKSSRSSTS